MTRQMTAILAAIALAVAVLLIGPAACRKWQSERSQSRITTGQQGAAIDSGKDALGTAVNAGEREKASEALTADNDRDIRAAEGAGERVKAPVDAAGRRALCQRPAYKDDPKCASLR